MEGTGSSHSFCLSFRSLVFSLAASLDFRSFLTFLPEPMLPATRAAPSSSDSQEFCGRLSSANSNLGNSSIGVVDLEVVVDSGCAETKVGTGWSMSCKAFAAKTFELFRIC